MLYSLNVAFRRTRIYQERVDMARRLMLAVTHPYSTFLNLIRHPQLLTEHTSGWFSVMFGYSLVSRSLSSIDQVGIVLGATIPLPAWGLILMTVGVVQIVSAVIMRVPHKGIALLLSFTQWLFLTILFYLGPEAPGVAMIFPVMTISCGLSYLSIIKGATEIETSSGNEEDNLG